MRDFLQSRLLKRSLFALALLWPLGLQALPRPFPTLTVSESFGVNIHFTHPAPGEMELIAKAGLHWVRMDLIWDLVEKEPGVYDFASYDHLVENLEKHGLKALFILDYGNPHYDGGLAPHTEAGRRAFARFAVAAARRYAGKGYLWEVWNEPNNKPFWRPRPKAEDYVRLAREVGLAFRAAGLKEMLVGPASARFPFRFLKKCLEGGLLEFWSAFTVHPYRNWRYPETVGKDYRRLRKMIDKYLPPGREIPTLSGEWGYSSAQAFVNEHKQSKYLSRMWLNNLAEGIPLSIWYDWKDDGTDPHEKEHHFGIVHHDLRLKPTYRAAQTLTRLLAGFRFERRIWIGDSRDYVLLFRKGEETRLVAWTSFPRPKQISVRGFSGKFSAFDYLGKELKSPEYKAKALNLHISDEPIYLVPNP